MLVQIQAATPIGCPSSYGVIPTCTTLPLREDVEWGSCKVLSKKKYDSNVISRQLKQSKYNDDTLSFT